KQSQKAEPAPRPEAAPRPAPAPALKAEPRKESRQEQPAAESSADAPEKRESDTAAAAQAAAQAASATAAPADDAVHLPASKPSGLSPTQMAEYYYQQGRARNDQKDYYGAVQLLREAVKLDGGKPHYHYHLGVALLKNPRTR